MCGARMPSKSSTSGEPILVTYLRATAEARRYLDEHIHGYTPCDSYATRELTGLLMRWWIKGDSAGHGSVQNRGPQGG